MFSHVVSLYRESQHPAFETGRFCYSGMASAPLRAAIASCEAIDDAYGRFIDPPDEDGSGHLEFCWLVGDNDLGRFYLDVEDFVARSQALSRGEQPQNFYLVEENYWAGEPDPPEALSRAYALCELIQLLVRISLPTEQGGPADSRRLVFVIPAGDKAPPRTLTLSTRLEPSALAVPHLDLEPLRRLTSDQNALALHVHEHRALFRLAVAEVVGRAPVGENAFTFLVTHWSDVLAKHAFDVDCYISNFSFEKVRLEISQMELEFSNKLSSVMGDSAAKFLALPLPFAVLIAIYRTGGIVESYLLFLGALVVSLLFSGLIHNQLMQLGRIDHGFEVIFDQFRKKMQSYPTSIADRLRQAGGGFLNQRTFLIRTLWGIRVLAWVPIAMGLVLLAWKFHPGLQKWLGL
ncbi:hypothetical protein A7X97_18400 [Stenotrophomonas sepilia]|uniref:hypothetical protein n=1 Tax=Stenotrophomonas TaxID=40323 RepID=UPI000DA8A969|nr:hypothetical protein [Stenotrophomonas sepilia]PZT32382.1 hypothetical protein A7X97_18400 [Stenotrophomonas sepilia]